MFKTIALLGLMAIPAYAGIILTLVPPTIGGAPGSVVSSNVFVTNTGAETLLLAGISFDPKGAPVIGIQSFTPPESLSIAPFATTPTFTLNALTLADFVQPGTYPFTETIQYKDAANPATIFTAVASGSLVLPEPASVLLACMGLLLFIGRFKSVVKQ